MTETSNVPDIAICKVNAPEYTGDIQENAELGDSLVRRQDVIDLIRSKLEKVDDAYDEGFAVSERSILYEMLEQVNTE